eukprot:334209_1
MKHYSLLILLGLAELVTAVEEFSIPPTTNKPTSSSPTKQPSNHDIPDEFGEVLEPGISYTFPGGSFTIGNTSVIVRPEMINSCSLRNMIVTLSKTEIEAAELMNKLQPGHPLFSMLVDINDMPSECPVLFGLIKNVTYPSVDEIKIVLVELDPSLIFLHSDINMTNAQVYEIPVGDITLEDTLSLF